MVLWDRDVAPTLDWEPRFVERDGVLWAEGGTCMTNDPLVSETGAIYWIQGRNDTHHHGCRCLAWCDDTWISQPAFMRRQMASYSADHDALIRSVIESLGINFGRYEIRLARPFPATRVMLRGTRAQRKKKRAQITGPRR